MKNQRVTGRCLSQIPMQLSLFDAASTLETENLKIPSEKNQRVTERCLSHFLRAPLQLILTNNRSSIITVKKLKDGCFKVRLHQVFVGADTATLRALAGFIRKPNPQNRKAMADFIRLHLDRIQEKPPSRRSAPIRAKGKVYDLAEILEQVSEAYRINAAGVRITWGQRSRKRKFRAIRFGSYYEDRKLIRIHPLLDRKEIPRFFVEYIVYHELLHAAVPDRRRSDGRRSCHHREFKQREKQFARYREALAFEKHLVQEHWGRRSY